MKPCTVPACPVNHYAKGYCYPHYVKARRKGANNQLADLTTTNGIVKKDSTICSVAQKDRPKPDRCIYSKGCLNNPFWLMVCREHRSEIIRLVTAGETTMDRLRAEGRLGPEAKTLD